MEGKTRSVLVEYRGTHKNLVSNHLYTKHALAKAAGVSYTTVQINLKGKLIAYDEDLKRKGSSSGKVEYRGTHENLVSNHLYTRQELADAVGISCTTVRLNLKGKLVAYDEDLRLKRSSVKMVEYQGTHENLKKGSFYTRQQIADALGCSWVKINNSVKGKSVLRDKDLESKNVFPEPKMVKFLGEMEGLETGREYTLAELSKFTGIIKGTLQSRIGANVKCYNKHLSTTDLRKKNTQALKVAVVSNRKSASSNWLKRSIV